MKFGRRVLFSLIVALLALSSPVSLIAHAEGDDPPPIVSSDNGGDGNTEGNYHTGSFPGG